jgi:hypothetical protein
VSTPNACTIVSLGAVVGAEYFVKVWTPNGFWHLSLPAQLVKRSALRLRPTLGSRLRPVKHIVPSLDIEHLRLLRPQACECARMYVAWSCDFSA